MLTRSTLGLFLAAGAAFALAAGAHAQTWDGGSVGPGDNNWTTPANWNPDVAPLNNGSANIIFAGSVRLIPNLNVAQNVNGITFNSTAGTFTIGGNTLTLQAGGITNNSTNTQTINSSIVVASGQTWNAATGNLNIGLATTITLNANLFVTGPANINFNASTAGPGILNKSGNGTLTVNAPLGHLGNTAVSAGTLLLGASNVLGDLSPVSLSGTGILNVNGQTDTVDSVLGSASINAQVLLPTTSALTVGNGGGSNTFAGTIAGDSTASFTKIGGGTLTLSGANTFPGSININGGTISLPASERLANTCTVNVSGATSSLNLGASATETIATLNIGNGASVTGSAGTLIANAYNLGECTIGVNLAGSGSLLKNAPGVATLTRSNTSVGPTIITVGTLALAASNTLADTSTVFVNTGATLQLAAGLFETIGPLSGPGTIAMLGNFTLTTITVNQDTDTTFDGIITGNSAANLTKVGTGTLTLAGANTYRGTTTVNSGILTLASSERLAPLSTLNINGGTLNLGSFTQTIAALTLVAGTITGSAAAPGTLTVNTAMDLRAGTIAVNLGGTARLTKTGAGTVVLSGTNTYTGGSQFDGGITQIITDANLGAPGTPIAFGGGTLRTSSNLTIARPIDIAAIGGGTIETLGTTTLTGPLTTTSTAGLTKAGPGTLILTNSNATCGGFNIAAGTLVVSPGVAVNNLFSTIVSAPATLTLSGALFSGPGTTNQGGRITLRSGAMHIGPITNSDGVLSGDGVVNGPLTNAAPADVRVASGEHLLFAGPGAHSNLGLLDIVGGEIEFEAPLTNGASTGLIFARNASLRFGGGLTNQGAIAMSFGVTDLYGDITNTPGATITISGSSDATFVDDVVNNGTIRTSTGSAAVFFGALSGSGSFPGTGTVFMEGDLRPGNSPGQIEFGGTLVLGTGATLEVEIAGEDPARFDRVSAAIGVDLAGTLDVVALDGFAISGPGIRTFTILSAPSIVGQFAAVNLPPALSSLRVRYTPVSVTLTNCLIDFNNDGLVSPDDLDEFITLFFSPPPENSAADFNNDGIISPDDLDEFITSYFDGC